jgi:hypothetical protein
MQDDQSGLFASSTPRESFWFSSKLRLPPSTPDSEIEQLVENMIAALGIKSCADTKIGYAFSYVRFKAENGALYGYGMKHLTWICASMFHNVSGQSSVSCDFRVAPSDVLLLVLAAYYPIFLSSCLSFFLLLLFILALSAVGSFLGVNESGLPSE